MKPLYKKQQDIAINAVFICSGAVVQLLTPRLSLTAFLLLFQVTFSAYCVTPETVPLLLMKMASRGVCSNSSMVVAMDSQSAYPTIVAMVLLNTDYFIATIILFNLGLCHSTCWAFRKPHHCRALCTYAASTFRLYLRIALVTAKTFLTRQHTYVQFQLHHAGLIHS